MAKQRLKAPPLGARVKASGYMARYAPPQKTFYDDALGRWYGRPSVTGWKRRSDPVQGCFFGIRRLQIGYWRFEPRGEDDDRSYRVAGYITVYAIAINRRAVRYVLPRDVEVMGDG